MKYQFSISAKQLSTAISFAHNATAKSGLYPCLSSVRVFLNFADSNIQITGFNLDLSIQILLDMERKGYDMTDEKFSFCLNKEPIVSLLSRLDGLIDVEIEASSADGDKTLTICSANGGRYKLRIFDFDNYPPLPTYSSLNSVVAAPFNVFKFGLEAVAYALSKKETQNILRFILVLQTVDNKLQFVASDGHRVAAQKLDISPLDWITWEEQENSRKIPAQIAKLLMTLPMSWDDEAFELKMSATHCEFCSRCLRVSAGFTEDKYPSRIHDLLQDQSSISATFERTSLISTVERASFLGKNIHVSIEEQNAIFFASSQDIGSFNERLPYLSQEISSSFKYVFATVYLRQALKPLAKVGYINHSEVLFNAEPKLTPVRLVCQDYMAIIMPCHQSRFEVEEAEVETSAEPDESESEENIKPLPFELPSLPPSLKVSHPNVQKLRTLAENLTTEIDNLLNSATSQQRMTNRRKGIVDGQKKRGYFLKKLQDCLNGLATAIENNSCSQILKLVSTKVQAQALLGAAQWPDFDNGSFDCLTTEAQKSLLKMGIVASNFDTYHKELLGLTAPVSQEEIAAEKVRNLEMNLINAQIPGFYPTPVPVIEKMWEKVPAAIHDGTKFLEPSAGKGDIAEFLVSRFIPKTQIDCIEVNRSLSEIIASKGFQVKCANFLELTPNPIYDVVMMNPPWGKKAREKATEHITHASKFLKSGGTLVALCDAGVMTSDQNHNVQFRAWLATLNAGSYQLPEGSFKTSLISTNVNLWLIWFTTSK